MVAFVDVIVPVNTPSVAVSTPVLVTENFEPIVSVPPVMVTLLDVIVPVTVAPVAVKYPLASIMALPLMFRVPPVMVEPVTLPEKTAAPVDALMEKVAVPPELKPAKPAELRTTRAPLVADAPE